MSDRSGSDPTRRSSNPHEPSRNDARSLGTASGTPPPEDSISEGDGDTPLEVWIGILGSSTLFHVLLLAFLAMLLIGVRADRTERIEVTRAKSPPELQFKRETTREEIDTTVDKEPKPNPKPTENPSNKNMEDVNEKFQQDQGKSKDFQSPTRNLSRAIDTKIGLNSGGGRDFGGERGGNRNLGRPSGPSEKTQGALRDALIWLAEHQSGDGHWDVAGYTEQCEGTVCRKRVEEAHTDYNVGVTGLVLLAFLGAGYTHKDIPDPDAVHGGHNFGKVVKKGLFWLKNQQNEEGAFSTGGSKPMYNNALATLAYAEAYGMTAAPHLKRVTRQGVRYLKQAQNEDPAGTGFLSWRYEPDSGDNDTSVTGWVAMAMKSAELAGLETPGSALEGALNWVRKVTNDRNGLTGYRSASDAGKLVAARGRNENYRNHPSMTAIGMLVRMFANKDPNSEPVKKGARALMTDLPKWKDAEPNSPDHPVDYYYWYYASLALYMYAGPDSPNAGNGMWDRWNPAMKRAILDSQEGNDDGHENGSWDPISRWSWEAGRVYATAINALTLEVYFRYDNAFMVGGSSEDGPKQK